MDPIRDPDLLPLDRELREIEFVERPSFAAELRARLRDTRPPRLEPRRALIAAAVAAIALAVLPLTDRIADRPAEPSDSRPVLVHQQSGAPGALYFAVNEDGTVLEMEARHGRVLGAGSFLVAERRQPAFVCMFEETGSRCGSPDVLIYESGAPLGPFVYRDLCCGPMAGAGGAHEGVLTISGLRESIVFIFLYQDANRDGRMSKGDRLRLRAHPSAPPIDEFPLPLYASGQQGFTGLRNGPGELSGHGMSVFVY